MRPVPMLRWLLVAVFGCEAALSAAATPVDVLVEFGLKDAKPTHWQGSAIMSGGEIESVSGYRFGKGDKVEGDGWELTTDQPVSPTARRKTPVYQNGVVIHASVEPGAKLQVKTNHGSLEVDVARLLSTGAVEALSGQARARVAPRTAVVKEWERQDDYPSACVTEDGVVWVAWQSYLEGEDRLYVAHSSGGEWSEPEQVPGGRGDLFRSACGWLGGGRLLVVWSALRNGDWDLWSAVRKGDRWQAPVRVTAEAGPDIYHRMAVGPDGAAWLVWQAFRGRQSDVFARSYTATGWSPVERLTDSRANDWHPDVAVGADGRVAVAYDSYRNGDYDVFARIFDGVKWGPEQTVIATPNFEAKAAVTYDGQNRLWIAWEQSTGEWGKDQGYVLRGRGEGQGLYRNRQIGMRCYDGRRWLRLKNEDVSQALPAKMGRRRFVESPRLVTDGAGTVWLAFRSPTGLQKPRWGGRVWTMRAWENYIAPVTGPGLGEVVYFPESFNRIDSFQNPVALPGGQGLAVIWHSQCRSYDNLRRWRHNRIFASRIPARAVAQPGLEEVPAARRLRPSHQREALQLARARAYTTRVAGQMCGLFRGDLHRHTEISWDGNGDGSIIDTFRYAIDAVALDYFEVTDHNQMGGPDDEYVWWRTQKLTDVFHHPPKFITLFGYERSLGYPDGHRNIINTRRGFRTFPFTKNPAGRGVAKDDGQQLYAYARKTGSIVISHTSGTRMGTDFHDNDPELEPVVEIYQGARTSYEYEGAPRSAQPGDNQAKGSGYKPAGFLWRAWEKGLRLGIIASSDHGSTHISYASVFASAPTREGIVAGLRRRSTFGATDNLILDVHANGHFMGEEFSLATTPQFDIRVTGTGPVSELAIIKNLKFVYSGNPGTDTVRMAWRDGDAQSGTSMYYVRVIQSDGQIAWGSPVWIHQR